MNHAYRSLFNPVLGTWVAVSELTRARGKRAAGGALLASLLAVGAAAPAFAQSSLYWDLNDIVPGAGSAAPSGAWNTAALSWSTADAGNLPTAAWLDGSAAVFAAGTDAVGSYTVSLGAPISASGLSYRGGNVASVLTIDGANPLTLAAPTGPGVNVDAGTTLSVQAVVAGTDGLVKTGAGTLELGATNTFSGVTRINGGTLRVANEGNLGDSSGTLALANGASLQVTTGGMLISTRSIALGAGGGVVDANGTAGNVLAGGITGSGSLSLVNTAPAGGTNDDASIKLTGTSTYDGGTAIGRDGVNGARLEVIARGDSNLGTGPVNIYLNSELQFQDSGANAGALTITTAQGTNTLGTNSGVYFSGGASAGSARITNDAPGTYVIFDDGTTAADAQITNNGARVHFNGGSSGGNAVITNNGGGVYVRDTADLSGTTVHNVAGTGPVEGSIYIDGTATGASIGALDGTGNVVLAGKTLTLGALNTSTTFSGTIVDDAPGFTDSGGNPYEIYVPGTGGALVKSGTGTLTLGGNNTYAGTTTVAAGTLAINGDQSAATGAVTVQSGATLGGSGIVGGAVTVADGGHLAPGNSAGTLTTGALTLAPGAQLDMELGQAGTPGGSANDLVSVRGNLTLDGTLNVTPSAGGTFGPGLYRLIDYTGALIDNGLDIGSAPVAASGLYVQTSVAQQVNLVNSAGATLRFWDGDNTANINNGTVDGGNGTMRVTSGLDRWTDAAGSANRPWTNGAFAVFQGTPGTVTVDDTDGNVEIGGAQFAVDGYTLAGAALTTTTAATVIRVGDGSPAGAAMTATIAAPVTGSGGLVKDDLGTLVLSAANSYSGGTTLDAGTLRADNDAALGSGALTINGGKLGSQTAATLANAVTVNGDFAIANGGAAPALTLTGDVQLNADTHITQATPSTTTLRGAVGGAHALTLDGVAGATFVMDGGAANTYSGATTVQGDATLQLARTAANAAVPGALTVAGNGAVVLAASEQIADGATVTVDSNGQGGAAGLSFAAPGLTETIGALQGSGSVALAGSTLAVGGGNFAGTLADGAAAGGGVQKTGSGTLVLSGANSYSGATTVAAGTLQAGAAGTFSPNSAHSVAAGATLDAAGFSQTVAALDNSGTVSLVGAAPGTDLTVRGAYAGHDGVLRLGTALTATGPSDRLVLDGAGASASGHTTVQVTQLGGLGALTTGNGIEVVAALNGATTTAQTSKDAFSLAGGHVDAGAYEYRLFAADAAGAGENWYLRSSTTAVAPDETVQSPSVPLYRAEVPLLAAVPAQLRQADNAMLSNMHRRMGDDDARVEGLALGERRAWARLIGADLDVAQGGTVTPHSSGHVDGLQAGTDLLAAPGSSWRAGVYVGQIDGAADVTGFARGVVGAVGRNDLRSQYLGGYLTYTTPSGFYADGVLQGGRHDYTAYPSGNAAVSGKGTGTQASIELGQSFALGGGWMLEPQVQFVHQQLDLDDVVLAGALVQQSADSGWITRAGLRVKGQFATAAGALQPYGRVNLYHGTNGSDVGRFIGPAGQADIRSSAGYDATEVAAGLTWTLSPRVSVYGEVGRLFDTGGDARVQSSVEGSAGVRVHW